MSEHARSALTALSDADRDSLSPSLQPAAAVPSISLAFEIKFLLDEPTARQVEHLLLRSLLPDPHCDPALGGMYAITNLALDTPDLGVFHRDWRLRNRKCRIRRYGSGPDLFFERKWSRRRRVRKRRVQAAPADLGSIALGQAADPAHAWFLREVRAHDLAPVCRVRYLRRALFGNGPDGPVRVTFDRAIRGALAPGWTLDFHADERPVLESHVVAEFKFYAAMPALLRAVIADLRLQPTGISKYRACARAFARELHLPLPETDHA